MFGCCAPLTIFNVEAIRFASILRYIDHRLGGRHDVGRFIMRQRTHKAIPRTMVTCLGCHKPMIIARRGPNLLCRAMVDVTYRCETCETETTQAFMGARSGPRLRVNKSDQQQYSGRA